MSKDRARPFSRKHRRYWITITGGMLLIGAINVGLGMCGYERPAGPPERIQLTLPPPGSPAMTPDSIALREIPASVMNAFALAFPRNVPHRARRLVAPDGSVTIELSFGAGSAPRLAVFREDGTLLSPP